MGIYSQGNRPVKGSVTVSKARVPQNALQNLKSKIESLTRNLSALAEKKARIEFEIRMQSKALFGKRQELKRLARSNTVKAKITLESESELDRPQGLEDSGEIQKLLQESDAVLRRLET